jgi:hypothetical protein
MEAHRSRRTRDQARKAWYAHYRQVRFARWFGLIGPDVNLDLGILNPRPTARPVLTDPCQSVEPRIVASS